MKSSESYKKWLETAYALFAEEGPENLSIKALAKQCGLPRTNFYYYFESKEELIDKIIELHFQSTTEIFNAELEKRFHTFIPDLYVVMSDFKLGVQFAKQLFLNRKYPAYNKAYKKGIALSADLIVPKFTAFFKIDLPHESAKLLWYTLTDAWFSRFNFDDYTVDALCASCYDVMDTVRPLIQQGISTDAQSSLSFDTPV